jgi:hypothetical protein
MSVEDLGTDATLKDIRVPPDQEIKRGWQTTTLSLCGTIRKPVSMEKKTKN